MYNVVVICEKRYYNKSKNPSIAVLLTDHYVDGYKTYTQ
jgi:hypothetical protein